MLTSGRVARSEAREGTTIFLWGQQPSDSGCPPQGSLSGLFGPGLESQVGQLVTRDSGGACLAAFESLSTDKEGGERDRQTSSSQRTKKNATNVRK